MSLKNLWSALAPLAMVLALQGCKKSETGNCDDNKDNDKNGQKDCADSACADDPACVTLPEVCDNNLDDDGDGDFDCDDVECARFDGCTGSACVADTECEGINPDCLNEDVAGLPGGYCVSDCNPNNGDADCEGGFCIPAQNSGICLGSCAVANCREGYACTDLGDGATLVCLPACTSNAQCTVSQLCDTDPDSNTFGLCVDPEDCTLTGVDEDLDGLIDCDDDDCDQDAGCLAAISDACNAANISSEGANSGDTTNGTNLFLSSCGGAGNEELFVFTSTTSGDFDFVLSSASDLGIYARSTCEVENTEINCADANTAGEDERMTLTVTAGTPVTLFVDAFQETGNGPYTLTIKPVVCSDGIVSETEECDDQNIITGDGCSDVCAVEVGFSCDNTASPSQCTDVNAICLAATPAILGDNPGDTSAANTTTLFIPTNAGLVQDCDFAGTGVGAEVLFSFTPLVDGNLTLTLASTANADLAIYVRTDCIDDTTEIGCVDVDFPGHAPDPDVETLTIPVIGGVPLTIFVDTFQNKTGAFTLTLQ